MAKIKVCGMLSKPVSNVADYLTVTAGWSSRHVDPGSGMLGQLWYRGVDSQSHELMPGVDRDDFTIRAKALFSENYPKKTASEIEDLCRLRLEREMLSQFRTAGSLFLADRTLVEIYFVAQHFGMPTRLLDWSTNPLAALYFACLGGDAQDGIVYAMDARKIIPENAFQNENESERLYPAVMTMRHQMVEHAVKVSFWKKTIDDFNAFILPVRPDTLPGRIAQQASCFTFHMHKAKDISNATMLRIPVTAASKGDVRDELHQLNINQFTVYGDLDHLAKEVRIGFGLPAKAGNLSL